MESQVLGFVGLGHMGGPMSSRLLDAGYSLCVFDTNPDAMTPLVARGARAAASPADVASTAPIVLMSLPTPPIVHAVALGDQGIVHGSTRLSRLTPPRASTLRTASRLGGYAQS